MDEIQKIKISSLPEVSFVSEGDCLLVVQNRKAKRANPELFKGAPGEPGESAHMRFYGDYLQWKVGVNGTWINLLPIRDITGPSAYEIAVKNGFRGTEAQWITSLSAASEAAAKVAQEAARKADESRVLFTEEEAKRAAAESGRVTAENNRVSTESNRVTAENQRAGNESGRVTAETARVNAENSRDTAETTRKNAESARVSAETARNQAETTRSQHEETRQSNETARINAESARASTETARNNAESTRVEAENQRISQEEQRVNKETVRVEAEQKRVEEETKRQSNEEKRQTQHAGQIEVTQKAIADMNDFIRLQIPIRMEVTGPKRITLGNRVKQFIRATLYPEGILQNLLFQQPLNNAGSLLVNPFGELEILQTGKTKIYVIPLGNTALSRQLEIEVIPPFMRLTGNRKVRLTGNGKIRIT